MIKAIVFDIWGTLGNKRKSASRSVLKHFGKSEENYISKYEEAVQNKKFPTHIDMIKSFFVEFDIESTETNLQEAKEIFDESLATSYLFEGVEDLLKILKKKYKLGILSNTVEYDSLSLKQWGIHDYFDFHGFSFEVGSTKPYKEAYIRVAKGLELDPSECVFVDDKEENIKAAEEVGMKGIQIISVKQLKEELTTLGVL
jgi:HAD superfamily hydrolase (TIGR01509 family)